MPTKSRAEAMPARGAIGVGTLATNKGKSRYENNHNPPMPRTVAKQMCRTNRVLVVN
jgi:hypothetical protein